MDLQILARIQALVTEREAMIAENMQRQQLGNSMAYTEDEFMDVANRLTEIGRG